MAFKPERGWGLLIDYWIIGNRGHEECRDKAFDGHGTSERKNIRSDVDLGYLRPARNKIFFFNIQI